MKYKLSALTGLSKTDIPIAYIKCKSFMLNDIFVIDRYEHLVEENIAPISNTTKYTTSYKNGDYYFLNIINAPTQVLLTSNYYYDININEKIPLFYKSKVNVSNFSIKYINVIKTESMFTINFDTSDSIFKSRKIYTSDVNVPIMSYYNISDANRLVKLYDISSELVSPVLVPSTYYSIDSSTMMVYIDKNYLTTLQGDYSLSRTFKLIFYVTKNPLLLKDTDENNYYKVSIYETIKTESEIFCDIYVYSTSKYSINISLNFEDELIEDKLIFDKTYMQVSDIINLTENTYYIFYDNNKFSNIIVGDKSPFIEYAISNELGTTAILSMITNTDLVDISSDHLYIETSYGKIIRQNEINPVNSEPGLTYEISDISLRDGVSYKSYTGQCIFINNNRIQLLHDNIIFTYDRISKTIEGIVLYRNNNQVKIRDYDDKTKIAYLDEDIFETDVLKVSYIYYKTAIQHKLFCMNPTPVHSYHNNNLKDKIVVLAVVAKEALIDNSPMSVFPFYLDRYVNNVELYYTYNSLVNILGDQNSVLGTPNDNGMSISELKRYLKSEYLEYNENTGYPHRIPMLILCAMSLINTSNTGIISYKDIRRNGKIDVSSNITNEEKQSRFDIAYYDSYPININNFCKVSVFSSILNSIAIKLYNKQYNTLTDIEKDNVKNILNDRIKARMIHSKYYIIDYQE